MRQQVALGEELANRYYRGQNDFAQGLSTFETWDKENGSLLREAFDTITLAEKYVSIGRLVLIEDDFVGQVVEFKEHVTYCLEVLEEIDHELVLYDDAETVATETAVGPQLPISSRKANSRDVFIVHGTGERWKQQVARFLERGGANPIILHERPNIGRTIIEKLEANSGVGYTVVILEPDDAGAPERSKEFKPRARQNVIFELGYFLGRSGRNRVCALYVEGVELPSDYSGIVYVPLDNGEGWKMQLARELRASGVTFDLNKATGA